MWVLTHLNGHIECKHSHSEPLPSNPQEANQNMLATLWRLELAVPQSRSQFLQLLFLFEVSPLVQPENTPAVLTHNFQTSSKRCLMYLSAYHGGAVCPIQYRICSNARVLLPENCGVWRHNDPYGRQCHLTPEIYVNVVTSDAFFVCFPVWRYTSLIATVHVKWLENTLHVREVRKFRRDAERGLWCTSPFTLKNYELVNK
jgi:hypothetical protein